jgi:hypothetical protein
MVRDTGKPATSFNNYVVLTSGIRSSSKALDFSINTRSTMNTNLIDDTLKFISIHEDRLQDCKLICAHRNGGFAIINRSCANIDAQ